MTEISNKYQADDEITLKELIHTILDYWSELWRHKLLVLTIAGLLGAYMGVKAFKEDKKFYAPLTFMINDDDGSGGAQGAGIGGLLGSFGLGGTGEYNFDKILLLSKSRKIAQNALFQKTQIDGKTDFLANHIIDQQENIGAWVKKPFYKFWGEPSKMNGFRFTHDSLSAFSKFENAALKQLHSQLIGDDRDPGLVSSSYEKKTGVMKLSANTPNPDLSIELTNNIFQSLGDYYVDKTTEKQRYTFQIVKAKKDSIEEALRSLEYSKANFEDSNLGQFRKKDILTGLRLEGKIKMGYMALATANQQLEIADFTLKNKTPFIQVIDQPILPIGGSKTVWYIAFIIGAILGSILGGGFVIARKIYKDALS